MSKSYRFRTNLNQDREVRLNIEQDFDMIEVLSLKLKQSDVYTRFCADYGVVAGRVIANGGYGVPNVNISIFVPLTAQDELDPVISTLYPYKRVDQKNDDGYRYNLLPYKSEYGGHTPTGTFPDIQDVLERQEVLEIYEKYYKYTVKTNESGDFMIVGVPLGMQVIVMDMDVSNIGCFSLRPSDLVRMGMGVESQFAGSQFRSSENIESLPQIVNLSKDIEISSFWGETDICNVGITRVDFDLREQGITIEPQVVFMGSMFSTSEEDAMGTNCKPKFNSGNLCDLVSAPGKILAIRQTIYTDSLGLPILEEYKLPEGGNVIDGEGTWLIEVPMNLDYVSTNEFGEQVISNDPKIGVPTKGKYRFKIQYQNEGGVNSQVIRADYLVPNIKEYGWRNQNGAAENGPTDLDLQRNSYAFSTDWQDYGQLDPVTSGFTTLGQQMVTEAINCDDRFFEFNFNRVYTVSSFIDRWKWGYNRARHLGIKEITDRTCTTTTNRLPVNDGVRNFDLIFFLFQILMILFAVVFVIIIVIYHIVIFLYLKIIEIVNGFIRFANRIILGICRTINRIKGWLGWSQDNCEDRIIPEVEPRTFPRLFLPMQSYPDCEACNCENVQTAIVDADRELTLDRINESILVDCNSIESWTWKESGEWSVFQSYCSTFPEGCDVTEDTFYYAINQGFAGFSGPQTAGREKIQRIPITTWMSQDSQVGAQAYTVSWAQILNMMNARIRYFENLSVIKTTVKNKDFNNVEQVSDTFTDQPFILVADQGTLSQLGGSGSIVTFNDITQINDPNLTGSTLNQFGRKSVTGTTNFNTTSLVQTQVKYAKNDYNVDQELTANLYLKLTGSTQSYNFPAGTEYFQVVTGGTLSNFKNLLVGEPWESFISLYVYAGNMKFRWGKGWGKSVMFGQAPDDEVKTIALTPTDQIILGGEFDKYGTTFSRKLVKIDSSAGNIVSFTQGQNVQGGFDGYVYAVLNTANNETFVGGSFSQYGSQTAPVNESIIKLDANGVADPTFLTNSAGGFNDSVSPFVMDIKQQVDLSLIVCGRFNEYAGSPLPSSRRNIVRILTDGSVDNTFVPPVISPIEGSGYYYNKVAIDQNPSSLHYQKIYVATYNATLDQNILFRLNTNGSLDTTFTPPFQNSNANITALEVDSNGKILIGISGPLQINNVSSYGIRRLNQDGSIDTTFNNGVQGTTASIKAIHLNPDGSMYIGGGTIVYNGVSRQGIARLNPDGTLDGAFNIGTLSSGYQGVVNDIKVLQNDNVVIGGSFGGFNGSTSQPGWRANLRMVTNTGSVATGFGFVAPDPPPLTTWRPVARGYNVYVEQVFNNFNNLDLIILTRGVDPYTPKQTIEYDISRLFNADYGTYKVKGEYYLNIPIQKNSTNITDTWSLPGVNQGTWRNSHLTPVSHDIEFNFDPRLYHKTFNNFNIPQNQWSAFTNNSVKYYTSTDKSRSTHKAYSDDAFTIAKFSNNGVECNVRYTGVDGFSTLGFSWSTGDPLDGSQYNNTTPNGPYVNNVVYGQGIIEGISFMGSNITPGEKIDILNPNNFARVYAPSYHLENTQDVQMLNRQKLVLRSDRLPVSSNPTVVGNTSLPLFLNDTFYIASITSTGEVEELNVTINQDISNANTQDFSGDTPSAVSDAIINSLSCEGLTLLSCYSGTGADFGVVKPCPANQDSSLTTQRVIGGCYYFVQAPYATATSINNDITNFTEWRARFTLVFAACRGVIGHVFQNNWVNGTLYSFGFKKKNIFDSQGNLKKYSYCGSVDGLVNPIRQYQGPIYFDDTKNTFLYRSTPYEYQTNQFIGQKPRYREFFGLGSWINANYDGLNKRNIYYPTTLMDLGPRDEFAKEICFNPQLDGYLVETLQSTSFNDTSDVLLFFILSRLLNSDLGNLLTAGNRQLNALFSRSEDRLDGDATQLFSINSEYGIVPFNDDNYNDDDVFLFSAVNSEGVSGPTIGLYFSSNTQNRILLTPGIQTYGTVLQNNGYPKTQVVPMYKWKYDTTSNMFGSELNDWDTDLENGGFYQTPYQKMKLDTTDYFQPQNGTGPFNGATGYIINYDSNGNFNQNILEFPPNQSSNFIVGAPYHFYFGLGKGKTAINRYITKYIIG